MKTRYKITFTDEQAAQFASPHAAGAASSRVRYVYGDDHPLLQWPGVQIDNAGYYDPITNNYVFSEPIEYFDGRAAPGSMLK